MSDLFLQRLQDLGFTHVSFDMARGCSITAWRGSERKTYSVYFQRTVGEAQADLIAQVEGVSAPAAAVAPQAPSQFEDLLG